MNVTDSENFIQTIVLRKVLLAGTPTEQHLIRQLAGRAVCATLRIACAATESRNRLALLIAGSPLRYR